MKLNECLGLFLEGQKLKIDFGNVLVSLPRMILDFDCSNFISNENHLSNKGQPFLTSTIFSKSVQDMFK